MMTASVIERNEKSIKMLEKIGFKYEGMIHYQDGLVNLINYYMEA